MAQVTDDLLGGSEQDTAKMASWIDLFQWQFNVFFAKPLDIDFSMLKCFTDIYQSQAPSGGGPLFLLPKDEPKITEARIASMRQVLAADITTALPTLGGSYENSTEDPLFAWYKYLFLDGSKPVSLMRAMAALDGSNWVDSMPTELKDLIADVKAKISLVPPPPPHQNAQNAAAAQ